METPVKQSVLEFGNKLRSDFPVLSRKIHNKRLVYLDSAATSLKPEIVCQAVDFYMRQQSSNVHRGIYFLSEETSTHYEQVRNKVARLINTDANNVVFTNGTTDGLNQLAIGLEHLLKPQDTILLTAMEHHANIVPWHMLASRVGCKIKFLQLTSEFEIDESELEKYFSSDVKIFSMVWKSNVTGVSNNVKKYIQLAKKIGAISIIDAAQAVVHQKVDVKDVDCDFLVFSAHKLFGPTGTGVLYTHPQKVALLKPSKGGGDMIKQVRLEGSTFADPPHLFEAGTPNISGVIGLGAAIDYFSKFDMDSLIKHEHKLYFKALTMMQENISGIKIYGSITKPSSLFTFSIDNIHPHDLSTLLDQNGICVRAGFHCAQPLHDFFGAKATTRVSFSVYNDEDDVDVLVDSLQRALRLLK